MAVSKTPFSALEKEFVASPDRARTLRVLASPSVERLNISLYQKLYYIKHYQKISYDDAFDRYQDFLRQTKGHPVYTAHPYLVAFCMFEQLPDAKGMKGDFIVEYHPKRTQKLTYFDKFGEGVIVKVPAFFKGFWRSVGKAKPISLHKNGEIKISLKTALNFVSRSIRESYEGDQLYREEIMQVTYKAPKERQKEYSQHFDFMCVRSGTGGKINMTVDVPKSSSWEAALKAYGQKTAEISKTRAIVGGPPSNTNEMPKADIYVRTIEEGKKRKVKIIPASQAKRPSQMLLPNIYHPYSLNKKTF